MLSFPKRIVAFGTIDGNSLNDLHLQLKRYKDVTAFMLQPVEEHFYSSKGNNQPFNNCGDHFLLRKVSLTEQPYGQKALTEPNNEIDISNLLPHIQASNLVNYEISLDNDIHSCFDQKEEWSSTATKEVDRASLKDIIQKYSINEVDVIQIYTGKQEHILVQEVLKLFLPKVITIGFNSRLLEKEKDILKLLKSKGYFVFSSLKFESLIACQHQTFYDFSFCLSTNFSVFPLLQ
jgi:hypothetical protein